MRRMSPLLLLLLLTTNSLADDLGYIRLQTEADVVTATVTLKHALYYVDGRFLVYASSQQQRELAGKGLSFELIRNDVSLDNQYFVYPGCLYHTKEAEPSIAAAMELGDGVRLAELSRAPSIAAAEDEVHHVMALSEIQVPFYLLPASVAPAPRITQIVPTDSVAERISQDSLFAYVSRLQAFYTRYLTTDSVRKAAEWLESKFESFGYDSVYQQDYYVTNFGVYNSNPVAVKLGTEEPEKIIVIGGHYDAIAAGNPALHAPGADDNATGTSVTLELARIFADIPTRKTLIFMPFGAEEIGLFGSWYAARNFAAEHADIEVMFNFDMVGFAPSDPPNLSLQAGPTSPYRILTRDAGNRLTNLSISLDAVIGASDHYPFQQVGYNIVFSIEKSFNLNPNYHQHSDSTTYLNFPFMTSVAKMNAAAISYIANAPGPRTIEKIIDAGNGNELEVFVANCQPGATYLMSIGSSAGNPNATVTLAPGECSHVYSGLNSSTNYYFSVKEQLPDGLVSVYAAEKVGVSQVNPRTPSGVNVEPGTDAVYLDWADNPEADLNHYSLMRKGENEPDYSVLVPSLTVSQYLDNSAQPGIVYAYKLTATDNDGNVSGETAPMVSALVSLSKPILLVDETATENAYQPTQEHQEAYWDTVFAGLDYELYKADQLGEALPRYIAGQYQSLFWMDDDVSTKSLKYSRDSLNWYFGLGPTNMLLSGFGTIVGYSGAPINPADFLYQQFHLQAYTYNSAIDFLGAKPASGWPTLVLDSTRGITRMGEIPLLTVLPEAEVIYRYDSRFNTAGREGQPVGLAYSGPEGKRILLAFPLYYLKPQSTRAFLLAAESYFAGAEMTGAGDLNGSSTVDIGDLASFIDYIYRRVAPLDLAAADLDGVCGVNVSDLLYLVEFLFRFGPAPVTPTCP